MSAKNPKAKNAETKSILARTSDGTLQITLTLPIEQVEKTREHVLKEIIEALVVPGFRKGKAPTDIAMQHIDKQKLYEQTLQRFLPQAYAFALVEYKIQPILQPRFELISVEEGKDWSVRAITCEAPSVKIGDYKTEIIGKVKAAKIWVPGKDDNTSTKQNDSKIQAPEAKEQEAIKALLEVVEVKIPKLLIEEEVNHRLAQLLDQVQRLGMSIEQYLSSTGRNIETMRTDYAKQAEDSIKLVVALNKVAEDQKIEIAENEIDGVISASKTASGNEENVDKPEQRRLIRSVLLRRKALDQLVSLV